MRFFLILMLIGGPGLIDIWAWPSEHVPRDPDARVECTVAIVAADGLATLECVHEGDVFLAHSEAELQEGDQLECRPKDKGLESDWFECEKGRESMKDDRPAFLFLINK